MKIQLHFNRINSRLWLLCIKQTRFVFEFFVDFFLPGNVHNPWDRSVEGIAFARLLQRHSKTRTFRSVSVNSANEIKFIRLVILHNQIESN